MGFNGAHYVGISVVLGAGLLTLWLLVTGNRIRDLPARAICSLTGHLRARPDPWLECTLRKAFAEFDRELTVILRDRANPPHATASAQAHLAHPAHPAHLVRPARPRDPGFPASQSDKA